MQDQLVELLQPGSDAIGIGGAQLRCEHLLDQARKFALLTRDRIGSGYGTYGIKDRKFLEIDAGTFDDRLKAMKPRVAFAVPNTLTGEGNLTLDITFEKLEDFSPDAVARKVDALNQLLQAREQLQNLLAFMDGKDKAQDLIAEALKNPALLQALASTPKSDSSESKE